MQFISKNEFRGYTTTTSKGGDTYYYFNLEDEHGESAKLFSEVSGDKLQKGQKYEFILDYSTKYGSIKIKGVK